MRIGLDSIVGQHRVKEELEQILTSRRVSHAYLFAGPPGVGKKALALAFAEALNGVTNLNPPDPSATSAKSSWYTHPDVHVFLPMPSKVNENELRERVALLAKDPYAIVDFGMRPSLHSDNESKNRVAFYSVEYYHNEIRPRFALKPNEGTYSVVVLCGIEKMHEKVANAFLKSLEEPPQNVVFLLITDRFNALLPTIVSRCQTLRCQALSEDDIAHALQHRDGLDRADAEYLARISNGNYGLARYYDVETLRETRNEIVEFLRASYIQDPKPILNIALKWSQLNSDGQQLLLNLLEVFLRDILFFRASGDDAKITNLDQKEVIRKFVGSLQNARLEEMIQQIHDGRRLYASNVNTKIWFTVLSLRFGSLMRGQDMAITEDDAFKHLPASVWS
jgi:DNA polymerase-3 subunit delta'